MTEDPYQFRVGDRPTPFSAQEIRQGCPPGRTVRALVVQAGEDRYVRVTRFLTGDEEGADQEVWTETLDGTRLTETELGHSNWRELQGHASMPVDATSIEPVTIDIPMGRFEGLRYTRTDGDKVDTFWFALSLPGAPVRIESRVAGYVVF